MSILFFLQKSVENIIDFAVRLKCIQFRDFFDVTNEIGGVVVANKAENAILNFASSPWNQNLLYTLTSGSSFIIWKSFEAWG